MNLALIGILLQILTAVGIIVWRIFWGGAKMGSSSTQFETDLQHLKEDMDELRVSIDTKDYQQTIARKELEGFVNRIEAAFVSHTGKTINGIDYRTEEH